MRRICECCHERLALPEIKYCFKCRRKILRDLYHYLTPVPRQVRRSRDAVEDIRETKFGVDR